MTQQPARERPVAFLGTGIMGRGMARNIARAGIPVRGVESDPEPGRAAPA